MRQDPGATPPRLRSLRQAPLGRAFLLAGALFAGSSPAALAASCESLLSAKLPHVTIKSAEAIPAGAYQPPGSARSFANLPAFCRVTATISPAPDSAIGIEVWLPATGWNGRYQQVGNHGWGGVIQWSELAPELQRGFATASTDDGHIAGKTNPFSTDWALGHRARVVDAAWRAVHDLAQTSKLLIAAYYGKPQSKSYFNGCSNGGREGLKEAHDFPRDFDGILIGGAAANWTHAATELLVYSQTLVASGIQAKTLGSDPLLALAQNATTQACDAADGVKDGVIGDPRRCRWNPQALICKPGQDPATCLTPAQAKAVAANESPVRDPATGRWVFAGQEPGSEFNQTKFGWDFGGLNAFGVYNYQLAFDDPNWNGSTFDLHKDLPRLDRVVGIMNVTDPNLKPFAAAGGKLIQWHGWDDAAFTPVWQAKYYEEVVARTGGGDLKRVQDFYRLFMMPGVGHCSGADDLGADDIGGSGQTAISADPDHDAVAALLAWVEHGVKPQQLIATKFNGNDATKGIQMQRPICPYPAEAIWDGKGDTNDASSFHCGAPPRRSLPQ